ncbi:hypothetical protein [Streptomyces sp. NBC_01089]|uniref:hypothetical protein n=1 Tax=Streptomyces sp. NBC_01089 TaxID=2903747 RepID=UPI0038703650|nr:tautomerase family protein [Streptomyces sp. NBC_01089]
MPHVNIKHWPRSFTEAEKQDLIRSLTETMTRVFACEASSLSIAVESVEPSLWEKRVHIPEIEDKPHLLWKRPNYTNPIPTEGTA